MKQNVDFRYCYEASPMILLIARGTLETMELLGLPYRSHCGYCDPDQEHPDEKTSVARGFNCPSRLPAELYQQLIDVGWRRSGTFIYSPVLGKTCCPLQSIRMKADSYEMTRSQRIALLKFLKFIEFVPTKPFSSYNRVELVTEVLQLLVDSGTCKKFSYHLVPFTDFQEKFELYRKYQVQVHGDLYGDVSPEAFSNFLIDNPFESKDTCQMAEMRYDSKLIGVGVLDILPRCISSVYFYYDPDYQNLSLGTISCMLEICLTRKLSQSKTILQRPFYYLGYYYSKCEKLRYKSCFGPYEILDRSTMQWESEPNASNQSNSRLKSHCDSTFAK